MVVGKFAQAPDVSGVAIGSQIMHTVTGLISSFAMGTTILLGQKLGEGDRKIGGKIISFFHGDLLCSAFSSDPEVVAAGFDYLKAYGIDCLLTCFLFCFIGFYNGLGRTAFVMIQGITAAFLIRIPVAYIMCRLTGRLFYIGLGIPCSTVFQITLCFLYFRRVQRTS